MLDMLLWSHYAGYVVMESCFKIKLYCQQVHLWPTMNFRIPSS